MRPSLSRANRKVGTTEWRPERLVLNHHALFLGSSSGVTETWDMEAGGTGPGFPYAVDGWARAASAAAGYTYTYGATAQSHVTARGNYGSHNTSTDHFLLNRHVGGATAQSVRDLVAAMKTAGWTQGELDSFKVAIQAAGNWSDDGFDAPHTEFQYAIDTLEGAAYLNRPAMTGIVVTSKNNDRTEVSGGINWGRKYTFNHMMRLRYGGHFFNTQAFARHQDVTEANHLTGRFNFQSASPSSIISGDNLQYQMWDALPPGHDSVDGLHPKGWRKSIASYWYALYFEALKGTFPFIGPQDSRVVNDTWNTRGGLVDTMEVANDTSMTGARVEILDATTLSTFADKRPWLSQVRADDFYISIEDIGGGDIRPVIRRANSKAIIAHRVHLKLRVSKGAYHYITYRTLDLFKPTLAVGERVRLNGNAITLEGRPDLTAFTSPGSEYTMTKFSMVLCFRTLTGFNAGVNNAGLVASFSPSGASAGSFKIVILGGNKQPVVTLVSAAGTQLITRLSTANPIDLDPGAGTGWLDNTDYCLFFSVDTTPATPVFQYALNTTAAVTAAVGSGSANTLAQNDVLYPFGRAKIVAPNLNGQCFTIGAESPRLSNGAYTNTSNLTNLWTPTMFWFAEGAYVDWDTSSQAARNVVRDSATMLPLVHSAPGADGVGTVTLNGVTISPDVWMEYSDFAGYNRANPTYSVFYKAGDTFSDYGG